jgi:hypothetical protein
MAVLYGVFLFMGVSTLMGLQVNFNLIDNYLAYFGLVY